MWSDPQCRQAGGGTCHEQATYLCPPSNHVHRFPARPTQAAATGNERAVKLLLRYGADVNHRDQYLQIAAM